MTRDTPTPGSSGEPRWNYRLLKRSILGPDGKLRIACSIHGAFYLTGSEDPDALMAAPTMLVATDSAGLKRTAVHVMAAFGLPELRHEDYVPGDLFLLRIRHGRPPEDLGALEQAVCDAIMAMDTDPEDPVAAFGSERLRLYRERKAQKKRGLN